GWNSARASRRTEADSCCIILMRWFTPTFRQSRSRSRLFWSSPLTWGSTGDDGCDQRDHEDCWPCRFMILFEVSGKRPPMRPSFAIAIDYGSALRACAATSNRSNGGGAQKQSSRTTIGTFFHTPLLQ